MFIPPINLGSWKPSPATLSEWIYQIWKYLQENPIATQEQIKAYVQEVIGSDVGDILPEILPAELDYYFEQNPIDFPVDSVNGKFGTVLLELADIVKSDSLLPIVSLANDEADQTTLVNAFIDGARFCLIDETNLSVMLPTYGSDDGVSAVTLLPVASGGDSGGDFSPITLSIGSSGNKTLNAGGTVAFTLQEIGAAPASLASTVSALSENVSDLNNDLSDLQTDVSDLKGTDTTTWVSYGLTFVAQRVGSLCTLTITGGTLSQGLAQNSLLTTIPEGFRPSSRFLTQDNGIAGSKIIISVGANGLIELQTTVNNGATLRIYAAYFV